MIFLFIINLRVAVLVILALTINLMCLPVNAEEATSETPAVDTEQTSADAERLAESQTLLANINTLSEQSTQFKKIATEKMASDMSAPEYLLFINIVITLEDELRSDLQQLTELQQQLAQETPEAQSLQQQLQQLCRQQSQVLQKEINTLKKIIIKLQARNDEEFKTQFAIARTRQTRYKLLSAWQENIERQKILAMDVSNDTQKLSQTIQFVAIAQTSRIQLILDAIKELKATMETIAPDKQQDIETQLHKLEWHKNTEANNLENILGIMKKLEMDTTKFGQALVLATGEILNENVETEAVIGLFGKLVSKSIYWLKSNLPIITFRLISFLLIILIFRLIASLVRHLIDKATSSAKFESSKLLQNFMGSIAQRVIMLIGLIIALSQLGIEIGPLLAGMGIMGFVVGFALQDTLSNFASGLMILVYRPFDIGDFVDVAGISGEVKQMNLVSTTLLTVDRKRMIIPNSKIWGDIITNVTAESIRRVDFVFGISYNDDINTAEAILHDIVAQHKQILETPEANIKLHALGESSVDFIVRPWVNRQDYWTVYWDITRQVKERFDAAGISIPYPQRDVHIIQRPKKAE